MNLRYEDAETIVELAELVQAEVEACDERVLRGMFFSYDGILDQFNSSDKDLRLVHALRRRPSSSPGKRDSLVVVDFMVKADGRIIKHYFRDAG